MMNNIKRGKSKKSQLTILVILALIIVVAVALILTFVKSRAGIIDFKENPQAYVSKCIQDSLQKTEKIILDGNGYLNITDNYILSTINKNNERVPYLCKTTLFYIPCMNQEPLFEEKVRKNIEDITINDSAACFSELIGLLRKGGDEVTEGNLNLKIDLMKDNIVADINKNLVIKRGENQQIIDKFKTGIQSPLYSLVNTAATIVNYESTICEFNNVNWMRYNQDISIRKFVTGDQTKIYTLTDKASEKKLSFAIKTCALPAGL